MNDYDKLIAEYSDEYCHFLEAAYGKGMMSEGGAEAIDQMFTGIDLTNKHLLDVGCGLGGVIFHLAGKHQADFTGLELNHWMVEEATRRTPTPLQNRVRFASYTQPPHTEFSDNQFDIIFSKGVLTHVKDKRPLFLELHRVLKPGGLLIIDDWLSPTKGQWGERVQKMCDVEDLTLYAETEAGYKHILSDSYFHNIQMHSLNQSYAGYNQHIVDTLKQADHQEKFKQQFGEQALQEAIECYQIIADAIRDNELLIRAITAEKH